MIDLKENFHPKTLFLLNYAENANHQMLIGSSEFRVGNDNAAFSTSNEVVKTGIVDGGIFNLSVVQGRYVHLRRNGLDPKTGLFRYHICEIRLYECPNLLERFDS